jgi:peroxiredoxin (alkyl hydroperoxide reductase subunit C)
VRGVFIVDPVNRIQSVMMYPNSVGRNIDEILRTLNALQKADNETVFTPANWKPGNEVLLPSPATVSDSEKLKSNPDLRQAAWYMWFKKS